MTVFVHNMWVHGSVTYADICVFVILSLVLVFCSSLSFFCLHTDILSVSSDVLSSLVSLDWRWLLVLLRSGSTVKSTSTTDLHQSSLMASRNLSVYCALKCWGTILWGLVSWNTIFQTIHPHYAEKDPDFFRCHKSSLGKQKLDATGAFQQQTSSVVSETLIKPCTLKMVKRVLGDASERKIQQISLSSDTVKQRINEMSDDIKEKVIQGIKSSLTGMFAIQLNESTDVSSCAQLLVFVRYVSLCDIKEEYLLCAQLETTRTA